VVINLKIKKVPLFFLQRSCLNSCLKIIYINVYLNNKFTKMKDQKKNLKIVFRSTFIHEIHLAKSKLENEGINSYLIDENLTYTIGTAFVEEYKLMVNEENFDKAHTVLSLYKT